MHYSNNPPFLPSSHGEQGIGGTENFACAVARYLVKSDHEVSFYNQADIEPTILEGINWANLSHFNPSEECDIIISFRMREVFQQELKAKLKVLILADTESRGLGDDVRAGRIDVVMPVGKWQMAKIASEEGLEGHDCWMLASNGVDIENFKLVNEPDKSNISGKCIHTSTPERGLSLLLDIWPDIERAKLLKDKGIQPELHLFSSFRGWGTSEQDNENMCKDVYARIDVMKAEGLHIVNHKHVNAAALQIHMMEADLFLYPTNFNETFCLSLTEARYAGAIPVVSNRAALAERISSGRNGFLVGEYMHDATSAENKKLFTSHAITALWLDGDKKRKIRKESMETACKYDYAVLLPGWLEEWQSRLG